jgi:transposase-like protein
VSEFWERLNKLRDDRIAWEVEQGIRPAEPEPEPPRPKQVRSPNPELSRRNHERASMTLEQARAARRRYEAGESSPSIAKDFGVTPSALRYHVRLAGGEMRKRGPALVELADDVVRDLAARYRNGASLAELERDYDCTRWQIATGFKKIGQPLRDRSEAARLRYDKERGITADRSEEQRKADLVTEYAADIGILKMVDGEWVDQPSCRCYRCGKLLTADNVIIDRYGPRQSRPVCEECRRDDPR